MFSRRRITIALVGLLILVLAGWLASELLGDEQAGGANSSEVLPAAAHWSAAGFARGPVT
ncbi:hypothetical protein H0B56_11955 [Haloechinothrix sp. YIM 98757]|uniref:Uncharacterized protein n=1 Tax=Haloechinothrix aidingensis TaxID=2752311 RepID=A0A838AAJ8_9PSEU|nr:hypothetical protein [Haloechinothrix aidingensis]MBA0126255.1 hypothetical protein [Haloechinothrix aidingensis]